MAAGLARTAALAIRRVFMMAAAVVRMQLLGCRSLMLNLRTRICAWRFAGLCVGVSARALAMCSELHVHHLEASRTN
jgi:hypothetical protein